MHLDNLLCAALLFVDLSCDFRLCTVLRRQLYYFPAILHSDNKCARDSKCRRYPSYRRRAANFNFRLPVFAAAALIPDFKAHFKHYGNPRVDDLFHLYLRRLVDRELHNGGKKLLYG